MKRLNRNILAVVAGFMVSQAGAATGSFSKTSGLSPDGSGAQVMATGMTLDERTSAALEREVLEAFARLHPGQSSTMVWIGKDADGRIEATALPYVPMGQGQSTQGGGNGPQPPTPPPPPGSPGTPDYVSRVDYHVINYNGWNRDTTYGRDVQSDPNGGGFIDGPWGDPIDDHVYPTPGAGHVGCGESGQEPCPKQN